MSRPCASVPNHQIQLGGSSAFMRLASITGSVCASHGANTPTKIASANSAPPMMRLVPSFIASHSCVSDPRIDNAIEQVDQHVDGQEEHYHHENGALDGR